MMDFILDEWPMVAVFAVVFVLLGVLGYAGVQAMREEAALMAECEKDHKHYECVSMLRRQQTAPVIIPVPMVVGR